MLSLRVSCSWVENTLDEQKFLFGDGGLEVLDLMQIRKVRTVILCLSTERGKRPKQPVPASGACCCLGGSEALSFSGRVILSSEGEEETAEECCTMFEAVHYERDPLSFTPCPGAV